MMREGDQWRVAAAGPTTSIREEPYEADIIKRFGIRAVMGKGGMGRETLGALKEFGAVYLHAIGGAAQFYARCLHATGVDLLEDLGVPEAMWHFDAHDFVAIVTMDSHGNSLHEEIATSTGAELEKVGAGKA
jgi:fumarate hydratase class I